MANAGRVELDLVAVGKDEVSAMLRKVEAQARQMAKGMGEAGTATAGVGAKLDEIKGKTSGVNKIREAFENLRSNAFFVVGAVTGVAAAIGGLTQAFSTNARAIADWEKIQGQVNGQLERTKSAIADINKILGREENQVAKTAEEALAQWSALGVTQEIAAQAVRAYQDDLARARQLFGDFMPVVRQAEDDLRKAEHDHNRVRDERNRLEGAYLGLLADRQRKIEALFATLQLIDPYAETITVTAPKAQSSGRGGAPRKKMLDTGGPEAFAEWVKLNIDPATGGFRQGVMDTDGAGFILDAPLGNARDTDASKRIASLEATGDALFRIGDSFSYMASKIGELDPKIGGLFESFGSIANIWKETGNSAESLATGVIGSVDSIATASAAWFKDEKARTRFLGAKELLLAAPLWFVDPAQAAAKTATGIGLLALAGGGGGSSASGGRGSNTASGGGASSGPSTIVYNFSSLVTDQQQVTTALRRAGRSSRGTGHESRAGV